MKTVCSQYICENIKTIITVDSQIPRSDLILCFVHRVVDGDDGVETCVIGEQRSQQSVIEDIVVGSDGDVTFVIVPYLRHVNDN